MKLDQFKAFVSALKTKDIKYFASRYDGGKFLEASKFLAYRYKVVRKKLSKAKRKISDLEDELAIIKSDLANAEATIESIAGKYFFAAKEAKEYIRQRDEERGEDEQVS